MGGRFERGVGQYPTVGDEVHFATSGDLGVIYGRTSDAGGLTVGIWHLAADPSNLGP